MLDKKSWFPRTKRILTLCIEIYARYSNWKINKVLFSSKRRSSWVVPEKVCLGCGYTEEVNTGRLKKEAPYTSRAMCVGFGKFNFCYCKVTFLLFTPFVKSFYAPLFQTGAKLLISFLELLCKYISLVRSLLIESRIENKSWTEWL